jgi:hypothetical protein
MGRLNGSTSRSNLTKVGKKPEKNEKKGPKPAGELVPEDLQQNHVAKVHVDGDIRMPKAIRDELALVPGDRWKFSIVNVSKTEFTNKAVKVESQS